MDNEKAIVLLDLQKCFFEHSRRKNKEEKLPHNIISHIKNFIHYYARPRKINVIWVNSILNSDKNESFLGEIEELILDEDIQITKQFSSAFKDTFLLDHLTKNNIKELIICGVSTNQSVIETAIGSSSLGFNNIVVTDCVDQIGGNLETFETIKKNNFAELISSCELIGKFQTFGENNQTYLMINILPPHLSSMFGHLRSKELTWGSIMNREKAVPRLVCIQGELVTNEKGEEEEPLYRHPADSQPELKHWTPTVLQIRDHVQSIVEENINHALIQCYRDGQDNIGEHSDKTLDIAKGTSIINVSLGAKRRMVLQSKLDKRIKQYIYFPHNSMLVFDLETNRKWIHSIRQDKRLDKLKQKDEIGERISFTFRTIGSFYNRSTRIITGQGAKKVIESEYNPDIDDSIAMLDAFGRENRDPYFDWDKHYAKGFYCINFRIINSSDFQNNWDEQIKV